MQCDRWVVERLGEMAQTACGGMIMNDYMELVDILMDELPEEHPWKGNVKGLLFLNR